MIKHEGSWVADSDVITKLLDEKYPENSLAVSEEKLSVYVSRMLISPKFLAPKLVWLYPVSDKRASIGCTGVPSCLDPL